MVFSPRLFRHTAQAALHSRPEIYSGNKGLENLTSATPLYVIHMTFYLALYVLRPEGRFCTVLPFTVFLSAFFFCFQAHLLQAEINDFLRSLLFWYVARRRLVFCLQTFRCAVAQLDQALR